MVRLYIWQGRVRKEKLKWRGDNRAGMQCRSRDDD